MKTSIPIEEVIVGERVRKNLGDLKALQESIERVGLLQPIVIRPDNKLVAGERRLIVCRDHLHWKEIPVHVVTTAEETLAALQAERDENTCRENFTPEEAVRMGKLLEPMEREAAQSRMEATQGNKQTGSEKFSEPEKGRAEEKVAAAVGMSRPSYNKANIVVDAAEKEPEIFQPVLEDMNRTGKVDPAYKEVKQIQAALTVGDFTEKQKKAFVALRADPTKPDIVIAQEIGIGHSTVARTRQKMTETGILDATLTRISLTGAKISPAKKEGPTPSERLACCLKSLKTIHALAKEAIEVGSTWYVRSLQLIKEECEALPDFESK